MQFLNVQLNMYQIFSTLMLNEYKTVFQRMKLSERFIDTEIVLLYICTTKRKVIGGDLNFVKAAMKFSSVRSLSCPHLNKGILRFVPFWFCLRVTLFCFSQNTSSKLINYLFRGNFTWLWHLTYLQMSKINFRNDVSVLSVLFKYELNKIQMLFKIRRERH